MCRVIAIANQKGGVGKTTTATCLGYGLANAGKDVLLIDADSQGNLTECLGYQNQDMLPNTLAPLLGSILNDEDVAIEKYILKETEHLYLIPGNIELSGLEVTLVNVMSRERVLSLLIDRLRLDFDYILIDCTPSLGMLTVNALTAADSVLIPVQTAYLPAKGLEQLLKTINNVKKQLNPRLKVEGILLTMVDKRTNYAKEIIKVLKDGYENNIHFFENEIPLSVRASEITALGTSIFSYDPKGKIAQSYGGLTQEIMMISNKEWKAAI